MDELKSPLLHELLQVSVSAPCTKALSVNFYIQSLMERLEEMLALPTKQLHKFSLDLDYNRVVVQSTVHIKALPYNSSQQGKYVQL